MSWILPSKARFPCHKILSLSSRPWPYLPMSGLLPATLTRTVQFGDRKEGSNLSNTRAQIYKRTVYFFQIDWMVLIMDAQLWTVGKTSVWNIKANQSRCYTGLLNGQQPFHILQRLWWQPLLWGYHTWLHPLHCSDMSAFTLHSTPIFCSKPGNIGKNPVEKKKTTQILQKTTKQCKQRMVSVPHGRSHHRPEW